MPKQDLYTNSMESWIKGIKEAQLELEVCLPEELEHYLALTLSHQLHNVEFENHFIAKDFLEALQDADEKMEVLRGIADYCLLLSGFFPHRSQEVGGGSLAFIIDIGQQSYAQLSVAALRSDLNQHNMYNEIGLHFIMLMDVLLMIRHQWGQAVGLDQAMVDQLYTYYKSEYAEFMMRSY